MKQKHLALRARLSWREGNLLARARVPAHPEHDADRQSGPNQHRGRRDRCLPSNPNGWLCHLANYACRPGEKTIALHRQTQALQAYSLQRRKRTGGLL